MQLIIADVIIIYINTYCGYSCILKLLLQICLTNFVIHTFCIWIDFVFGEILKLYGINK